MIETKISIGSINSVDFYGVNNTKIQLIQNFFPKMTISARGNEIIVKDDTKGIILFGNYDKNIKAITKNQSRLIEQSSKNNLLFAVDSAGTRKTYTAIALAVRILQHTPIYNQYMMNYLI